MPKVSGSDSPRVKTIYNISPYPLAPSHDRVAVLPGASVRLPIKRANELLDFPDWSEDNPRALPSPRPAETQSTTEPAESGDQQETSP